MLRPIDWTWKIIGVLVPEVTCLLMDIWCYESTKVNIGETEKKKCNNLVDNTLNGRCCLISWCSKYLSLHSGNWHVQWLLLCIMYERVHYSSTTEEFSDREEGERWEFGSRRCYAKYFGRGWVRLSAIGHVWMFATIMSTLLADMVILTARIKNLTFTCASSSMTEFRGWFHGTGNKIELVWKESEESNFTSTDQGCIVVKGQEYIVLTQAVSQALRKYNNVSTVWHHRQVWSCQIGSKRQI